MLQQWYPELVRPNLMYTITYINVPGVIADTKGTFWLIADYDDTFYLP